MSYCKIFFDAFLRRLAKSKYVDSFIFKGGFLLSANLGIDFRSTIDMDFLLRNLTFAKDNVKTVFENIIREEIDDLITFELVSINDIREEDQYGGFNISLLGRLENIKVPVSIDVATGDPITPSPITHEYKCLFDNETLNFSAYNFETIIAEKLQTILIRGALNSRSKDFYDLYIIYKLRFDEVDKNQLATAFANTCKYRGTVFSKEKAVSVLEDIKQDEMIKDRWESYTRKNAFASGIKFEDTLISIFDIADLAI
ncbi:MAG: nucleotidyl transferase AbiEii/AbiGii toxin family protein [Bacteroidales bacterium]|jgi:predicted nucleotidyltransferase component of viral defense system|nr:nucleotidyl transferase AbiEii/AbiGii toxin family protein [Bacteroidales bacterium]